MKSLFLITYLIFCGIAPAQSPVDGLYLTWNTNPEKDISNYIITIRSESGKIVIIDNKLSTKYNFKSTDLELDKNNYITIIAKNNAGLESKPSEEIKVWVDSKPPVTHPPGRYIVVSQSLDGGLTYKEIGRVSYPSIRGQKYKTNIVTVK